MTRPIYFVDVFTSRVFGGNPAPVVPLDSWPDDRVLAGIGTQNQMSDTAFIVPTGPGAYELRWFTPTEEMDLCGHATLAAGFVAATYLEPGRTRIEFSTRRAGPLAVTREQDWFVLDFPVRPAVEVPVHPDLCPALGGPEPQLVRAARDYLVVYNSEDDVRGLMPDFRRLAGLDRAVIVTAPGREGTDFVSRFFGPQWGFDEDPVTGSSHCTLIPYWAERLGRNRLSARQVSQRGGTLACELAGDRVRIGGQVVPYLEGRVHV